MGFFKEYFELITPPRKQNTNNKTVKIKSLNGYGAIRETLDEGNTITVHASAMQRQPVINEQTKPKTKAGIGL